MRQGLLNFGFALFVYIFYLTLPAKAAPDISVEMAPTRFQLLNAESQKKLTTDLQEMVTRLSQNGDPDFTLRVGSNFYSTSIRYDLDNPKKPIIQLEPGAFAFAQNLSEVAGVLAYHISQLKNSYQQKLSELLVHESVPIGTSTTQYIKQKIGVLEGKQKSTTPESPEQLEITRTQLSDFQKALKLSEQNDRYNARQAVLKDVIAESGVTIDLSDLTKRNIKAAQESADRLVSGGFDPWGILSPLGRMKKGKTRGPMSFMLDKLRTKRDTSDSELEFIKNYLLYLEQKKVDITQQPLRNKPLTNEQAQLHWIANFTQSALFGPAMKEWMGTLTFSSVAAYFALRGNNEASQTMANGGASGTTPILPSEVKETPGSSVRLLEQLSKLPVIKPSLEIIRPVVSSIPVSMTIPIGVGLILERMVLSVSDFKSNIYLKRMKQFLQGQLGVSWELTKWKKNTPKSAENLLELAKQQELSQELFPTDGRNPEDTVRARTLYQILFTFPGKLHSTVEAKNTKDIHDAYKKRALARLRSTEPSRSQFSDSEINAEEKKLAYEELFLEGVIRENISSEVQTKLEAESKNSGKYQKFLHNHLGVVAELTADKNTADLLDRIEIQLKETSLSSDDRAKLQEALLRIKGLVSFSPSTQEKYLKLTEQLPSLQKEFLITISESRQKNLSPPKILQIFRKLVDQKLFDDATLFLSKHLGVIARFGKNAPSPEERDRVGTALDTYFSHWSDQDVSIPRRYLRRNLLFLRAMTFNSQGGRTAMKSFMESGNWKGPMGANYLTDKIISATILHPKDPHEFLDQITTLREQFGAEPHFLAHHTLEKFQEDPSLINDESVIDRILEMPYFWKSALKDNPASMKNWEKRVADQYGEHARQYEAFTYDPIHSEALQAIILKRYSEINPQATLTERFEFWRRLAHRGATGLTDRYIDELFAQTTNPDQKGEFAQIALEEGLVWDQNLRGKLYRASNSSRVNERSIDGAPARALNQLDTIVAKSKNGADFLKQAKELLIFDDASQALKQQKELNRVASLMVTEGDSTSAQGAWALFKQKNTIPLERAARLGAITQEIKQAQTVFPETGYGFASVVNWIASQMQANQSEVEYLKKRFITETEKGDDLGYSVINEIVNDSLDRSKAQRWQLVRWLRGSGPAPTYLADSLKRFGPETIRRFYSTLPIFARQAFMGALLGTPGKGLLEGVGKKLYTEQVLNEILPSGEKSAEIASELLSAFLRSVEKVSHPEKKISVLSYLLANHADSSDTGSVLKNVCEAYGVTGVKFGQQLASSDILPPDVRSKLGQLRDQANEPLWHEIYQRISEILKEKYVNKHLKVKKLLGSASIKYAVLVTDKTGEEHVLQIKREEAEASISRDFQQLDLIVEDLIKKSPSRYSFLRGMISANKAAIWRELSLVKESEKSELARLQYATLPTPAGSEVNVPENTSLVKDLPGPATKDFFLRSSLFVPGQSIDQLPPDERKQAARAILAIENDVLFSDRPEIYFDPDRHPGNELISVDPLTGVLRRNAIDWGQLLSLEPASRARVIRLMSYTQLLERIGPIPKLMQLLAREFGIEKGEQKKLEKALLKYFPNKKGEARSSLAGYFHLLSELENAGLDRKIVHYDFIKAIYQLEYYEQILQRDSTQYKSPKTTLTEQVKEEVSHLTIDLKGSSGARKIPTPKEIGYALSNPLAAATALKQILKGEPSSQTFAPTSEKQRPPLRQPEDSSFMGGVTTVYGAELINSIFWSIWDKNPQRAISWLRELKSLEKHFSFGTFAVASSLYDTITSRAIPMSQLKLRYLNHAGISLAVGTVAADIARRVLAGEKSDRILDHLFSKGNLKDVSYVTLCFMAANATVDTAFTQLGKINALDALNCKSWYQRMGKTALSFILAEELDRKTRQPLTKAGILDATLLSEMKEAQSKYDLLIQKEIAKAMQLLSEHKCDEAQSNNQIQHLLDEYSQQLMSIWNRAPRGQEQHILSQQIDAISSSRVILMGEIKAKIEAAGCGSAR